MQQRELPWRTAPPGRRDAYAVWVSEVMAQQTRLATVVDYYVRWMDRFPTVPDLAEADLQEVLKAWEGLGYYPPRPQPASCSDHCRGATRWTRAAHPP